MNFKVVRMCKDEAMAIVPQEVVRFDLNRVESILKDHGYKVSNPGVMVTATKDDHSVTVYKSGRMLLLPSVDKAKAQKIASDFYDLINEAKT